MEESAEMSAMPFRPRQGSVLEEWRGGWLTVLVSLLGYAIATTHTYSLGVFMAPMQTALGWSRAEISAGFFFYSVMSVICSPVAGLLIDRYGVRYVGMAGMAVYCATLALFSTILPLIWMWWLIWLLLAVGGVFVKPTLWATAISRRFSVSRGLALAVMLTGSGISSAAMPVIALWLIDAFGWRMAYLFLGCAAALVMLPLMALFFREDTGRKVAAGAHDAITLAGLTVRDAVSSYRFIAIAIPTLLMTCATIGTVVHFVPIMIGQGVPAATAAMVMGVVGFGSVAGRLTTGVLLDRLPGALVGAVAFMLPVLPILLLLTGAKGVMAMIPIGLLIGLSVGSEVDIVAYVTSRYFGLRSYGTVFGTLIGIMALGAGIGPTLAGYAFDLDHSYRPFFIGVLPCLVLSSVLMGTLGKYPSFATPAPRDAPLSG